MYISLQLKPGKSVWKAGPGNRKRSLLGLLLLLFSFQIYAQNAWYISSINGEPWGVSDNLDIMDDVFGRNNWNRSDFSSANVASVFNPGTCLVFLEGSESGNADFDFFFRANQTHIEDWVRAGGKLFVNYAFVRVGASANLGFGISTVPAGWHDVVTANDPNHPVILGPFRPVTTNFTGSSFAHGSLTGNGMTGLINDNGNVVLAEMKVGRGLVIFGTLTTPNFHFPKDEAYNLRRNTLSYLYLCTNPVQDDVAVMGYPTPGIFCPGTETVSVRVGNYGLNRIDSFRVNWTLNGVLQTPVYWSGTLDTLGGSGSSEAVVVLDDVTFVAGQGQTIRVWTSHPNGNSDGYGSNDTMEKFFHPALSGTYTVGGRNGDYASLTDVGHALNTFGVCGPVTFHLDAVNFNERLILSSVPGASRTNTLTFIGAGKRNTVISYSAAGNQDIGTVLIRSTPYVTFRDMTIEAQGFDFGAAIMLVGASDYSTFKNLELLANRFTTEPNTAAFTSTGDQTAINSFGLTASYLLIDSCELIGGNHNLVLNGGNNMLTNNTITNNVFMGCYSQAIRCERQDYLTLSHNGIYSMRDPFANAMTLAECSNFLVEYNDVRGRGTVLNLYNPNANNHNATFTSKVNNNFFYWDNSTTGVDMAWGHTFEFTHNTVSGWHSGSAAIGLNNINNIRFVNNIVANWQNSRSSWVMAYFSSGFAELDANIYFSNSSELVNASGTVYNTLEDWKVAQPDDNQNSYQRDPLLRAPGDPSLPDNVFTPRGLDIGVIKDIHGDTRCAFAPSIGADESAFQTTAPRAGIANLDTLYSNSPSLFVSMFAPNADERLAYRWYVDGTETGRAARMTTDLPRGTYQIALSVLNCSGSDSTTKTVNVVDPTSTPVSDFAASTTVADLFQYVQLNDLSSFGPTSWEWTANPSVGADFSNAYTQNPSVAFLSPGEYEICLRTENALGQGTTLCKTQYISVTDEQYMCSASGSDFQSGKLLDEGGTSNYSDNMSCDFLIAPCASKVTLRFDRFSLSDEFDTLRIYDGVDNKGTLLGSFNGFSPIPGGATGLVANSGKMFIEWRTGPGGTAEGFVARWVATPDFSQAAPTASFTIPDTIYTDAVARFESTSTGTDLKYNWDFDPPFMSPGQEGGAKPYESYVWNSPGNYPIQLVVRNCGGLDTITHYVDVVAPTSTPAPGFFADKDRVPVMGIVSFTDTSNFGVFARNWEIFPKVGVNPLSSNKDEKYVVSFTQAGTYDVILRVTNSLGSDSILKIGSVEVFEYCQPVVFNTSTDIGINRVRIGSIDNYSPSGKTVYTSYLSSMAPAKLYRRAQAEVRVERNSALDSMNRKVWIDWNGDGDFNDALELIANEVSSLSTIFTQSFQVPAGATTGFTVMRVATAYGQGMNQPCGINITGEFEDYPIQVTDDEISPELELFGADTVQIEQWHAYIEPGYRALDEVDGNLTSSVLVSGNVDSTQVGTYRIQYRVLDQMGNQSQVKTRVVVVTPDVTRPFITLNGTATVSVRVNTSYTDAGAVAMDYFNRNLNAQMFDFSNVNIARLGTYHVSYSVQDAAGNKDSVVREVKVIDDVAPQYVFNGTDTVFVEVRNPINDPGLTFSDNYHTVLDLKTDSSAVNTRETGIYWLVYTAKDPSGNTTVVNRPVKVQDLTLPVINLIGNDTVWVDVNRDYVERGAQVRDNYCQGLLWEVDQQPNTRVIGDYLLTYTVTDCEGNAAIPVTRLVRVQDNEAPALSLKGFAAIAITRWESFTDSGVTILDNYYDEATLRPLVQATSNLNIDYPGLYSICYQVTDPSGNVSNQVCRTIRVDENLTSAQTPESLNLNAYPNPTQGSFTLQLNGVLAEDAQVQLRDMAGRLVYQAVLKAGETQLAIQPEQLRGGLYILSVGSGQWQATTKVQVVR